MGVHLASVVFLCFLCWISAPGSEGLKDVKLDGPNYIREGEDVIFSCKYNTEQEHLYAVKWYKGLKEFYRFVPKEVPPQKVFPLHGMDIEVSFSGDHQVFLRNVSLELTGTYRCVVSVETTFQTLEDIKMITVVAIDYDPPILQLDQLRYHPGSTVIAKCYLERVFPLPNITWTIDNNEVSKLGLSPTIISIPQNPQGVNRLFSVVTTLNYTLPEKFVPTEISCRFQLFDLYDEFTAKRIQPSPRNYNGMGSSGNNGGGELPDGYLKSSNSTINPNLHQKNSAEPIFKIQNLSSSYYLLWIHFHIIISQSFNIVQCSS